MIRLAMPLLGLASLLVTCPVSAFMFADGTTAQCIARGRVVKEKFAAPGDSVMATRAGFAAPVGDGWQITWNLERLQQLPAELRDFLFFHECAHARIPTTDELTANCAGLKDMRAAGRAGPAFEAKLRAQVDLRHSYWANTFKCADDERAPAPPAKPAG